jgi:hypothetical protein
MYSLTFSLSWSAFDNIIDSQDHFGGFSGRD